MKPQLSDTKITKLFKHMANEEKIEVELEVRVVDKANLSGRLIKFKLKA